MEILVIDGQGGGLGARIVEALKRSGIDAVITAVGTNSAATGAMLRAGADRSATGENPVKVCARNADVIIGPVGIVIADSMLGEITPEMAEAVARADAERILLPVSRCSNHIAGAEGIPVARIISEAVSMAERIVREKRG